MSTYWSTRIRRGLWTKNYHWRAANWARLANFFMGRGLRTPAEIRLDQEKELRNQRSLQKETLRAGRPSQLNTRFTVACILCNKKFKRSDPLDLVLRPHKDQHGLPCSGRHGILQFM
jgi:hypothetical protein